MGQNLDPRNLYFEGSQVNRDYALMRTLVEIRISLVLFYDHKK